MEQKYSEKEWMLTLIFTQQAAAILWEVAFKTFQQIAFATNVWASGVQDHTRYTARGKPHVNN